MRGILLVLGAGTSIPASMPSTREITDLVLTGKGVVRHTDSFYYVDLSIPQNDDLAQARIFRNTALLRLLKSEYESARIFFPERPVTYEDLMFALQQLRGDIGGYRENPGLRLLKIELIRQLKPLLRQTDDWAIEESDFLQILNEASNYLYDIVMGLLSVPPGDETHLDPLMQCLDDEWVSRASLFTLNHDRVLESLLERRGIGYCDGFRGPVDAEDNYGRPVKVKIWNREFAEECLGKRVSLFKLHGSVSWLSKGHLYFQRCGSEDGGEFLENRINRNTLLIGTHNKAFEYSRAIFADLQCLFRRALRESRYVIVAGYSFQDAAINSSLFEWLERIDRTERACMAVINPNIATIYSGSENARRRWQEWRNAGKVVVFESPVQRVNWPELKREAGWQTV